MPSKRKAETVPHNDEAGDDATTNYSTVKKNDTIEANKEDEESDQVQLHKVNRAGAAGSTSKAEALKAAEAALEAALFGRGQRQQQQQQQTYSTVIDNKNGKSSSNNINSASNSSRMMNNSSSRKGRTAGRKDEDDRRKWQEFFFQLAVFKQKNGHLRFRRTSAGGGGGGVAVAEGTVVGGTESSSSSSSTSTSSSSSPLARWVVQQRTDRKRNKLTEDQVLALDALGFVWDVVKDDSERTWEDRYQELIKYKQQNNGSTQVPLYYEGGLGRWCSRQRSGWKIRQQYLSGKFNNQNHKNMASSGDKRGKTEKTPKPHQMISQEQVEKLQRIHFRFELYKQDTWDARVEELAEYKSRFGHCNVPQHWRENKGLGKFVARQRYNYCLLKQGKMKCKSMTQERIDKLEAMGFDWGKFRPSTWTDPQTEESKQEKEESIEKRMESKRGGEATTTPAQRTTNKDQSKRPRGRPRKDVKAGAPPPDAQPQQTKGVLPPTLNNATIAAPPLLRQPGNEIAQRQRQRQRQQQRQQQQRQQQQHLPAFDAAQQ